MKKFWAILLAVMLVLSMVTVASATETENPSTDTNKNEYTITAPKSNNGHTYEILQIFTGDFYNNTLSNLAWGANGNGTLGALVSEETINELKATEGKPDTEKLAYITKNLLKSDVAYATIGATAPETYVESVKVPAGYYLIRDKAGSQDGKDDSYTLYIVNVADNVTITPKADKPSMTKKIKDTNDSDGTVSDWQDSADYDIGDEVPYRLQAKLPSNFGDYEHYKFTFHDTMEKGLRFNPQSVKVYVNGNLLEHGYLVKEDVPHGAESDTQVKHTFDVEFEDLVGLKYEAEGKSQTIKKDDIIEIEYTATLTADAVIGEVGNLNTAYLEFSNNPNGEGTGETPEDTVIAFTYKLVINKVAKNEQGELAPRTGAEFELLKWVKDNSEEGGKWVKIDRVTVDEENAVFTFTGLDDGDYKLVESVVPAGYNKMADVTFTISASHMTAIDGIVRKEILKNITGDKVTGNITLGQLSTGKNEETKEDGNLEGLETTIENKSGASLPETGGIGTTIFYVLGSLMFVGATLILVVRRKAEADEN